MADWDEDSPRLRHNLAEVLSGIRDASRRRQVPRIEDARKWHGDTMNGLEVPDPRYVGKFRGESGPVERYEIEIGGRRGTRADEVASELKAFEQRLQQTVAAIDALIPVDTDLDTDRAAAVIDLCAWAHAEWVRIHPFVNANGPTARLWANGLLMRYGLPPFVRLRPRPGSNYGSAGAMAMRGDWKPTAIVFRAMLRDYTAD
ncbi:hypothetical protein BH24PSE2_BH24PSE2_19090 [soil metagenome]